MSDRSAAIAVTVGGLLMAALYVPFTLTHGPTSINEEREILGADMHVWGLLLGVLPTALIGLGLWGLRTTLAGASRVAHVALGVASIALLLSAALDLAFRALGPPLMLFVLAPAVVVTAASVRRTDPQIRLVLAALGAVLVAGLSTPPTAEPDSV